MAKVLFYDNSDLLVTGQEPTAAEWNSRLFTKPQAEMEKRDSYLTGFYVAPSLAANNITHCVDFSVDGLCQGARLDGLGTGPMMTGQMSATYWLYLTSAGTAVALRTALGDPPAGSLVLGQFGWNGTTIGAPATTGQSGILGTAAAIGAEPAGTAAAAVTAHEAEYDHRSLDYNLPPVLDRLDTPPGSPTTGDRYLIIATASGAWTGKEKQFAEWTGAAWAYTAPVAGMSVDVIDEATRYGYHGTAWGAAAVSSIANADVSLSPDIDDEECPANSVGMIVEPLADTDPVVFQVGRYGYTDEAYIFVARYDGEASHSFALRVKDGGGAMQIAETPDSEIWTDVGGGGSGTITVQANAETPITDVDTVIFEDGTNTTVTVTDNEDGSVSVAVNTEGGGSGSIELLKVEAGGFNLPATNPAETVAITGSNAAALGQEFAYGSERKVWRSVLIPAGINASGTVTFTVAGKSATAVSSKNIALKVYYAVVGNNEALDKALSTITPADFAVSGTSGNEDILTFTESAATMGLAAGKRLLIILSRPAASSNDLSYSWLMTNLLVEVA